MSNHMQARREPQRGRETMLAGPITTSFRLKHPVIFHQLKDTGLETEVASCTADRLMYCYVHFFGYKLEQTGISPIQMISFTVKHSKNIF